MERLDETTKSLLNHFDFVTLEKIEEFFTVQNTDDNGISNGIWLMCIKDCMFEEQVIKEGSFILFDRVKNKPVALVTPL